MGSEMWHVFEFPENCWNRRSKRIEAVRTHRYGCWSSNERVCNRSVRTTLTTEPSRVCLIELKAELTRKAPGGINPAVVLSALGVQNILWPGESC